MRKSCLLFPSLISIFVLTTGLLDITTGCEFCGNGKNYFGHSPYHGSNQYLIPDNASWDSCRCAGSYKFPVPPLYTYHWPGQYSQQLMTDYQSPWRFPPLRPYTDEKLVGQGYTSDTAFQGTHTELHAVNHEEIARSHQSRPERMSNKMERFFR